MSTTMNIHQVAAIELAARHVDNGNSRTLLITLENGDCMELTFFGETDALEHLPKSEVFWDHSKELLEAAE